MKVIGTLLLVVLIAAAVLALGGWGTMLLVNLLSTDVGVGVNEIDFLTGVKLFALVGGLAWLVSPAKGGE
jgi:hypothetical protein